VDRPHIRLQAARHRSREGSQRLHVLLLRGRYRPGRDHQPGRTLRNRRHDKQLWSDAHPASQSGAPQAQTARAVYQGQNSPRQAHHSLAPDQPPKGLLRRAQRPQKPSRNPRSGHLHQHPAQSRQVLHAAGPVRPAAQHLSVGRHRRERLAGLREVADQPVLLRERPVSSQ